MKMTAMLKLKLNLRGVAMEKKIQLLQLTSAGVATGLKLPASHSPKAQVVELGFEQKFIHFLLRKLLFYLA